jgi:hypothetical protein
LGTRAILERGGRRRFSTFCLWLALSTLSALALGQSPQELAKARTLFKEGVSLEAAGDWANALGKFQEVAKVKSTAQVKFHMGRCKEHLGRFTEALGDYRLAEYDAQQANAKELPEITKAREELEARIPKLVIRRGEGAEAAKIELDGVELGETQIGKEFTVDPGPHRVVAKLSAGEFEQTVEVGEGETKEVELVPPDDFKPKGGTTDDTPVDDTPKDTGKTKIEATGPGALPWIIGGVGVVSLAASGYFFLQRNKAEDDLNNVCRGDVCPRSKQSLEDDGKKYAMLTNITLGVGVVGVGVATVLLLSGGGSSSQEKPQASSLTVNVIPTPQMAGVNVAGRF